MTQSPLFRWRLLWLAPLALAACSQSGDKLPPDGNVATPAPAVANDAEAASASDGGTIGGDGSQIVLNPLTSVDIKSHRLAGELACSFATSDAAPLILARGDVASKEAARGLVKVMDSVEDIAAPGGYDGITGGATFSGAGKTIHIVLTGPAEGDGESPPRPATLTYLRADGASRAYVGSWTCGP